jgi:hypothetical protein
MFKVTVHYMPNEKIVRLSTHGTLDIAADRELVAMGKSAAVQYGTTRFLVDHRSVELNLRLMDVQDVPLIGQQGGIDSGFSIALLHNGTARAKELFSFLDDLSYLQHGPRRAFIDETEAIAWLISRPARLA